MEAKRWDGRSRPKVEAVRGLETALQRETSGRLFLMTHLPLTFNLLKHVSCGAGHPGKTHLQTDLVFREHVLFQNVESFKLGESVAESRGKIAFGFALRFRFLLPFSLHPLPGLGSLAGLKRL